MVKGRGGREISIIKTYNCSVLHTIADSLSAGRVGYSFCLRPELAQSIKEKISDVLT